MLAVTRILQKRGGSHVYFFPPTMNFLSLSLIRRLLSMPLALCQVAALLGFSGHGPLLASRSPPRGATRSDGRSGPGPEPLLSPYLEERKVEALFGWVSRAFAGDERYNNLMVAFAAIFGEDAKYASMVEQAVASLPGESDEVGEPLPLELRERGSLGAMGAGQWTGSDPHRSWSLLWALVGPFPWLS